MKTKCLVCNNDFDAKPNQKLCSTECKRERTNWYPRTYRQQRGPIVVACVICGKEFEKRTSQVACSDECVKEKNKRWMKKYQREHMDRWVRGTMEWRAKNPEKYKEIHRIIQHRRRARIRETGGTFSYNQWKNLCESYCNLCAYCHKPDLQLTADHIIPISRGGSNDISNIAPACLECNNRKYTMTAQEFLTR